jgi:hypothetical protein
MGQCSRLNRSLASGRSDASDRRSGDLRGRVHAQLAGPRTTWASLAELVSARLQHW